MKNVFIPLIEDGRIATPDALKRAYRRLVMKTHPDVIGSNRLVRDFLEFSEFYEEAKSYLSKKGEQLPRDVATTKKNYRLEFFRQLKKLEAIDTPYTYRRDWKQITPAKAAALEMFDKWSACDHEFYTNADIEYDRVKSEKPEGPYLKKALGLNLLAVFDNVIMFHLTGRIVYQKQVRQNFKAILDRLNPNVALHLSCAGKRIHVVEEIYPRCLVTAQGKAEAPMWTSQSASALDDFVAKSGRFLKYPKRTSLQGGSANRFTADHLKFPIQIVSNDCGLIIQLIPRLAASGYITHVALAFQLGEDILLRASAVMK